MHLEIVLPDYALLTVAIAYDPLFWSAATADPDNATALRRTGIRVRSVFAAVVIRP